MHYSLLWLIILSILSFIDDTEPFQHWPFFSFRFFSSRLILWTQFFSWFFPHLSSHLLLILFILLTSQFVHYPFIAMHSVQDWPNSFYALFILLTGQFTHYPFIAMPSFHHWPFGILHTVDFTHQSIHSLLTLPSVVQWFPSFYILVILFIKVSTHLLMDLLIILFTCHDFHHTLESFVSLVNPLTLYSIRSSPVFPIYSGDIRFILFTCPSLRAIHLWLPSFYS